MKYIDCLYLDKEKDIIIEFYKDKSDYFYLLKTPNHHSGNLITNLARIFDLPLSIDENGLKIIWGQVTSYINENNQRLHIVKFKTKTVAVIDGDDRIRQRASIPAISKTFMSQSKQCNLSLNKTLVRTYIEEKLKFKTDLHTHMNANLHPDILIALGIKHQIQYPFYYVKKLGLKLSTKQNDFLNKQYQSVSKKYQDSSLQGKYLDRKISDNTFINFADLILNNWENAKYNIEKIRSSLTILKDGQAVFTNLEKLYIYRYVFTKGQESNRKIKLKNIEKITDKEIKNYLLQMLTDEENDDYKGNSLLADKLLWIGRSYKRQGIEYVEISNTVLVKKGLEPIQFLETCHRILPLVEKETGVKIRFLAALRRIPLTIIKDNITPENYLRENLDVLKAIALDPYVVGSDFVGEEINEVRELKPVIKELVEIAHSDPSFTIRIHAGENDSLMDNVADSIKCVKESLAPKQKMPLLRLGHGLYTPSLSTKKGKALLREIKENNVVLEFQITSNVRLNNLNVIENHPLKQYLKANVLALQGTDGCGIYGTDSLDEQLALINLLKLSRNDMEKIVKTEEEIIKGANKAFVSKTKKLNKLMGDRSLEETMLQEINKNIEEARALKFNSNNKLITSEVLRQQEQTLPLDKVPVIVAGGSFNSKNRISKIKAFEKEVIDQMLEKLNPNKYFFVIGHKLNSYEKYLFENRGKFDTYAIVPADITIGEKNKLQKANINVVISTESLGMGIYKSFNYEIFERRPSIVVAIDGNSAAGNLVQEAKNGKAKALIFVMASARVLFQKAQSLAGYVNLINDKKDINKMIKMIREKSR